jgi:carboxylesterase
MKPVGKKSALVLGVVIVAVLSGLLYSCAAQKALEREVAETPRDAESGVVCGAEAVTLGGDCAAACLLVHGWVGSRKDFSDLGERLAARGFTVRLMRLPGHGTTPTELMTTEVEDLLDGVRREFQSLKQRYESVTVIGFSLGGALSTLLAAEGEVDRLVLVAPFFDVTYQWYYVLPPETWNLLISPFVPFVIKGKGFVRVNRREAVPHIYSYRVIPTHAVTVLCEAGQRAGSPECLQKIKCPVLLVHAEGDMAACPDAAREAFEKMASEEKQAYWFHDSNHHLLWDFDGPRAMEKIEAFLTKEDSGS